ncbi:MAG: TIGR02206 family membrane protein [Lentisphaerae bacterium]|nr:TIGR02206 family membrane protein [Lentisphaerota bacterium]
MTTDFQFGSLPHLLILAAIPALAGILAWWARRWLAVAQCYGGARPATSRWITFGLGTIIALNELIWYGHVFRSGAFRFPEALPLDLCDLVLWLTVFALFTRRAWAFELGYYWALAGTSMAVLTPDLAGPFLSYANIKFFLAHGGVVTSILFLTWSRLARPRNGSLRRAFLLLNGYVGVMALFNALFKTNYLYLCAKPEAASLLDYFGPWPWYLLAADVLALMLFTLLWLPFRPRGSSCDRENDCRSATCYSAKSAKAVFATKHEPLAR